MIYFMAEDSNSAHTFWIHVLETFADAYTEVNTDAQGKKVYGNSSLESRVNHALARTRPGDSLFIAFDNIGSPLAPDGYAAFDSGDFILNTEEKCRQKQVRLYITNYYCFEEVFISYEELESICLKDGDAKLAATVGYVREQINRGSDYFDKNNPHIAYIMSIAKDAGTNKEHFADALLYQATRSIEHGYFAIGKEQDGFGRCWITACEEIRHRKQSQRARSALTYFCNHCAYTAKNADTKQKLLDIENRSVLKHANLNFEQLRTI